MLWSVAKIIQSQSKTLTNGLQSRSVGMFEPKGQRVSLLPIADQMCAWSPTLSVVVIASHSSHECSWPRKIWVDECVLFLWVCSSPP